ncbi:MULTISPECIES: BTAD domain-containing putative transcriptional regulator [unclassified Pseudonocardia]|uniref:AfsR/SARP family transcriptional regulator n=1 Tax=unclassified Pseudonocardia TaxID=2619320 RepID=UPI0001FFE423|nr:MULTISPECIES: BTAD domain-containing putative transcriptional regulator [unclassified Pseudonocardia]ALE73532.1 transcriptional regulator [Pseudonocardia sp. EC080625-04]ALL76936.1 transcriptional regulator [Pseudonocardia sp. EC080610-09]ALL83967.1 transcriptional regulator [Pseudonocardia sp. EC080619-01]OLM18597.1 putative transcriptional regulator [Pseudonocardia sp. Ae707_Ps1]
MRIQLHGQFVIENDSPGTDIRLPGRRARLLVAYLAAHGSQAVERSTLIEALWSPERPSADAGRVFDPLLSKTRAAVAPAEIRGRAGLRLVLPSGSLVDADRAAEALHDAEAAASRGQWRRTWAQALSAMFVTQRPFLPEVVAQWAERRRTEARAAHVRATACYTEACIELGGAELASAERCARRLVAADPLAERGSLLLMRAVNARGDRAAALAVFAQLHRTLRDELGVSPGPQVSALHQALLGDPPSQPGLVPERGRCDDPAALPGGPARPDDLPG